MATKIKCEQSQKHEIKEKLLQELGELMDSIRERSDSVSVEETLDGLTIDYPIGEIYGYASDYVQSIPCVFDDLKKKYPNIEVWGIAYEYETVSYLTFGPLLYCKSSDSELTVTYEWQECAQCGEIIEGDAVYNSSQKDFEEGNLLCLCCPTCMLEYALDPGWGKVEGNASLSDEEQEEVTEDEEGDVLKTILWNRVCSSMEDDCFIKDFSAKKSRIQKLVALDNWDEDKRTGLTRILGLLG